MTLEQFFQENPRCALGFSGGVDSAYLLYAGVKAGADIRPYFIKTAFQPAFELADAQKLAEGLDKDARFRYLQDTAPADLFDVKPAVLELPEKARMFQSYPCDGCGEVTAEHLLRLENGKKLCLDCFQAYNRFDV